MTSGSSACMASDAPAKVYGVTHTIRGVTAYAVRLKPGGATLRPSLSHSSPAW